MDQLQEFEWGTIEWIYMPGSNPYTVMNIGTVRIRPGNRQNKHVHYSDEQLLYILSGSGRQIINDEINTIGPGMIFHMNPGDMHETINTGSEDLVELLISIPVDLDQEQYLSRSQHQKTDNLLSDSFDLKEFEGVIMEFYNNLLRPLNVPVSIYNAKGELIMSAADFPEFCRKTCRIEDDLNNCELYRIRDDYKPPYYFEHTSYVCRFGISVLYIPIIYRRQVVGFIRGGHVREAGRMIEIKTDVELPFERSKSAMNSLLRLMIRFQKNIQSYLLMVETDQKIMEKDTQIRNQVEKENELEKSLEKTRSKMLNIQINNHFLFNTLNAISNLALDDGSLKTYDAIINLSKMFRYNMNSSNQGVALLDEIEYIRDYLNLQKIRFNERIDFIIDLDRDVMNTEVPFNFLQPIVENAFTHGIDENLKLLKIKVKCQSDDNWLRISVEDNGKGMGVEQLERLNQRLTEKSGRFSGLVMVLIKLEKLYGNDVTLDIESTPGERTMMTVIIPKAQVII
jgi:mannose-6-phosphate isomerase-like protein (cupin superfamily)/signal transduction histidine kinase